MLGCDTGGYEEGTIFWGYNALHSVESQLLFQRNISRYFISCLIHRSWRRYVPPKRRLNLNGLHGVVSVSILVFLSRECWTTLRQYTEARTTHSCIHDHNIHQRVLYSVTPWSLVAEAIRRNCCSVVEPRRRKRRPREAQNSLSLSCWIWTGKDR
jgi:hypothetical protein